MHDLKAKTIRGGLARLFGQGATFLLRLGSLMVLARLLGPRDFGLVGMVTAFTGVLILVPGFRAFICCSSACDRHRGAAFNVILGQHSAWSVPCAGMR